MLGFLIVLIVIGLVIVGFCMFIGMLVGASQYAKQVALQQQQLQQQELENQSEE